jgi:hypothetical protein
MSPTGIRATLKLWPSKKLTGIATCLDIAVLWEDGATGNSKITRKAS